MVKPLTITLIIIVILIVGIGLITVFTMQAPSKTNTQNTPTTTNQNTNTPAINTGTTNTAKTYTIDIQSFTFSPLSLTIKKGDTVIWTNKDTVAHTVTSDSGSELNSPNLANGITYSHTFTSGGTFNYHCTIHPSMKAEIIVE